jgi:hypothetical protein
MIQRKYFMILAVFTILVIPAYADPTIKPTSAGTINVGFTTDPVTPNPGDSTQIKLDFINKKENTLQPHVDYKVSVMQGGNQVFGIPITHTGEGAVSIPFQFQTAGTYQITVEIEGLVFQPIPPETVTFSFDVGTNSTSVSNQTNSGTIKIPNWVKNTAGFWHDNQVSDDEFVKGIQYLITNGIMKIPPTQSGAGSSHVIPSWIKKDAGFWHDGQITNDEFVKGIQYLITNGIMKI